MLIRREPKQTYRSDIPSGRRFTFTSCFNTIYITLDRFFLLSVVVYCCNFYFYFFYNFFFLHGSKWLSQFRCILEIAMKAIRFDKFQAFNEKLILNPG